MADIYVALIHYPVYNKNKKVVSTCITGVDLHDIARSALTYGIKKYFVVNPQAAQIAFAKRIVDCWKKDESYTHNWTRAEAFSRLELAGTLEEVMAKLKNPILVMTSARPKSNITYAKLRLMFKKLKRPVLILFGTGWGMADELFKQADYVLPPIKGKGSYNHLSVRSAAAVIMDRLLGG
jgi:hypothetical protein